MRGECAWTLGKLYVSRWLHTYSREEQKKHEMYLPFDPFNNHLRHSSSRFILELKSSWSQKRREFSKILFLFFWFRFTRELVFLRRDFLSCWHELGLVHKLPHTWHESLDWWRKLGVLDHEGGSYTTRSIGVRAPGLLTQAQFTIYAIIIHLRYHNYQGWFKTSSMNSRNL